MKDQPKKLSSRLIILASVIALSSVLLLSGCGSSNNDPSPTIIPDPVDPVDLGEAGVRDDVLEYIIATHTESATERAALYQYAKVMQAALADAGDKELSIQHANKSNRANTCLWYTFGTVAAYGAAQDRLNSVILNTNALDEAYLLYNEQLDKVSFKRDEGYNWDTREDACDIDPTTLPD